MYKLYRISDTPLRVVFYMLLPGREAASFLKEVTSSLSLSLFERQESPARRDFSRLTTGAEMFHEPLGRLQVVNPTETQ